MLFLRISSFGVIDRYSDNVDTEVTLFVNPSFGGILIKVNGQLESKILNTSLNLKMLAASKPIRLVTYSGTCLSLVYDLAEDRWIMEQEGVSIDKLPPAE